MERTVPAVGELWGTPVIARRLIRILRALRPSFPVTGFDIPRVCVRAIGLCAIRAIKTWLILSLALSFSGAKNISLCEPRRIRELFTLSLPLEPRCGLCVVCFRSLPHFTSLKFTCCAVYFRLKKMQNSMIKLKKSEIKLFNREKMLTIFG